MGRNRSRGDRGLVDMSGGGDDPRYEPPKGGETTEFPIELDDEHRISVRMYTYRGKVVDFAIMQDYLGLEWAAHVYRVDCEHGEVHSHQFFRNPNRAEERTVIEVIPHRDGGWDCVDRNYLNCLDSVTEGYAERYRRWEG